MSSTTIEQIHYGDIGTPLRVTLKSSQTDVAIDISDATTLQIILQKPDGTILTKDASFVTDGTDGQLQYVIQNGDLNMVGDWQLQVYYVNSSGSWKSNMAKFRVWENL